MPSSQTSLDVKGYASNHDAQDESAVDLPDSLKGLSDGELEVIRKKMVQIGRAHV